jgi:putative ABC transport system permease protein
VKRPVETVSDTYRVKITAIADNNSPLGFSAESWNMSGLLFIPESHPLVAEIADYITPYVMAIADSGHGEEIKEYVDNDEFRKKYNNGMEVSVEDIESEMKTVRNTILLFEILIYGFIAVVSLIGVTNIFNTITTNIALRAKEFAVLKSIGMTNKEFNRMIRLESAMYTTRALLIGLPLGLLMSYGISRLFSEAALDLGWIIPWGAIVICIVVVALLVAVIMRYSVRKIKKQNIIETIRKESF